MSAEKNIEKSTAQLKDIGVSVNEALLEKVVKKLGIANQSVDASHVAATDKLEVERLKTNFVIKKLVLEKMKPHKMKQRGAVYYLLTTHYSKEDLYLG